MANYGRDVGEAYSNTGKVVTGGMVLMGVTALLKWVNDSSSANRNSNKTSDLQKYDKQIADCDRRINELSSGLLGSWLNQDQIAAEKKKRTELQRQRGEREKKR